MFGCQVRPDVKWPLHRFGSINLVFWGVKEAYLIQSCSLSGFSYESLKHFK